MTYLTVSHARGSAPARLAALIVGGLLVAGIARATSCPDTSPPIVRLVDTELAFATDARTSVRQAFLHYLADEALVLQPGPVPGRPWYESHAEGAGTLQWYPHVAGVAASGDLGFTSGPYVYTRDAAQSFGQFLTVWRLDAACRWRVAFDGGISHAKLAEAPPVDPSSVPPTVAPPRPPEDGVAAFQAVAGREGLGAALRTYGRNEGFLLLLDGQPPLDLAHAERQLRTRVVKEVWREAARGASADGSLQYVVGSLGSGAYAQIWQYDARTANRGLRVLLLAGP